MFDKLKDSLRSNLVTALAVPSALSGVTFITNVVQSLKDGNLSHSELQNLISSASGLETLVLLGIIFIIRI